MNINVIGGGWVTANSHGRMRDGTGPSLTEGIPDFPTLEKMLSPPPARYRRFDSYTKIGFAAIALALTDAGLDRLDDARPVGIVVSSVYECFEVDLAYYDTTHNDGGLFASPNLFSYTLPGIITGEAAIHFKLTGPTFTVGDDPSSRGLAALTSGVDLIRSGSCQTVISGWLDSPGKLLGANVENVDPICGAVFVVLSAKACSVPLATIKSNGPDLVTAADTPLQSILDLF